MNLSKIKSWIRDVYSRRPRTNLIGAVVIGALLLTVIAIAAYRVLSLFLPINVDARPENYQVINLALIVAAGFGVLMALVVNFRKQKDLEEGRFVERFGAAAAQLSQADPAARIAGVYAMAGVADRTKNEERQQCIDVLCGYLRLPYDPMLGSNHLVSKTTRRAFRHPAGALEESTFLFRHNDREVRQTIVRVIANHLRLGRGRTSWSKFDFDFTGVYFEDADFRGATFSGDHTSFDRATFSG
ncbi:MAG: pentapeptide repeat-containing protein, partial [Specibacter sp.]